MKDEAEKALVQDSGLGGARKRAWFSKRRPEILCRPAQGVLEPEKDADLKRNRADSKRICKRRRDASGELGRKSPEQRTRRDFLVRRQPGGIICLRPGAVRKGPCSAARRDGATVLKAWRRNHQGFGEGAVVAVFSASPAGAASPSSGFWGILVTSSWSMRFFSISTTSKR